jgi:hypothetical protein
MTSHSISEGLADHAGVMAAGKSSSSIESVKGTRMALCMYIRFPEFLFKVFEFYLGGLYRDEKKTEQKGRERNIHIEG